MDALNGVSASFQNKPVEPVQSAPVSDLSAISASMAASAQNIQIQKADDNRQPSEDEIKNAINTANKRAQFGHTNAQFSYHEETHSISIKIIDRDTNEVVKEIPSEETLEMISKMWDLAGIMIDEKR